MAHVWSSRTLDAPSLAALYEWLDRVPLSKIRNNVEKDFADGVLAAEIVKFYFPDLVELKEYRDMQNIKERVHQWNQLNTKVFRRIGLYVPSHVITQLSIAKTGVAQIFLYNLRTCLTLYGANTHPIAPVVLANTSPLPPVLVRPSLYEDPLFLKYNLRYNYLKDKPPLMFQSELDYYWQKKQAERALKSDKSRSYPNLQPAILPPLSYRAPIADLAAAKIELDDKNQAILDKDDEIQFLKGQLKRMEVLLNNKNSKIQDLTSQLEKFKPVKR